MKGFGAALAQHGLNFLKTLVKQVVYFEANLLLPKGTGGVRRT